MESEVAFACPAGTERNTRLVDVPCYAIHISEPTPHDTQERSAGHELLYSWRCLCPNVTDSLGRSGRKENAKSSSSNKHRETPRPHAVAASDVLHLMLDTTAYACTCTPSRCDR